MKFSLQKRWLSPEGALGDHSQLHRFTASYIAVKSKETRAAEAPHV